MIMIHIWCVGVSVRSKDVGNCPWPIFQQLLFNGKLFIMQRKLSAVSADEWDAIPEVGDVRNKKQRNPRKEKYSAMSDSFLAKAVAQGEMSNAVDLNEQLRGGLETPGLSTPSDIDMKKIGQARNSLMDIKLSQVSR